MKTGAIIAARRVFGAPMLLGLFLAFALVLVVAALEREAYASVAVDRTLLGGVFGLLVPLVSYALVARAVGNGSFAAGLETVARHGSSRRRLAAGVFVFVMIGGALGAALLALAGAVVANGLVRVTPEFAAHALSACWTGLAAGAAYAALFGLGSCLGKRGGGRSWLLVLDWVFGRGAGLLASVWPRAHARNLLGAEPVLGLSPSASLAALIVLAAACLLLALRRLPP